MTTLAKQRGFVHSRVLDLLFLFVLILMGLGAFWWLSNIFSGDFPLAFFMIWLMAAAAGWWFSHEQRLLLRVPVGFLVFLGIGAVLAPLSEWSGSKIAVAVAAGLTAFPAKFIGNWWSQRLEPNVMPGIPTPWYLDQSINLFDDLFRWIGLSILAWFAVGVLPLILVMFIPVERVPWGALVWSFAATAFYLYKYRKSRLRFLKVPLGLYVFVLTAVLLLVFQKQIAGTLEAGSFEQIAYVAYWPAVTALFVEIVMIGTRDQSRSTAAA
ncbi:MAG TPA: hypothetical protein VKT74_07585 [Gammaproteobacteria bacterium]|nr:hypothetical protein [Gammaproteobacteria bacterium]